MRKRFLVHLSLDRGAAGKGVEISNTENGSDEANGLAAKEG